MAHENQSNVKMTVERVRRTGAGDLISFAEDEFFKWSGETHSSNQGSLKFKLGFKLVRKEMPGSNDVVHQALSSTWQPITFNGEWRDIWMGSSVAKQTYLDFSNFAKSMPLVRVTLDGLSFVGMLEEVEFDYINSSHIGWSFILSPEENENVPKSQIGAGTQVIQKSIPQWSNDVTDSVNQLTEAIALGASVATFTEDANNAATANVEMLDALSKVTSLSGAGGLEGLTADLVSGIQNIGSDVTDLVWALPVAYQRVQRAAINVAVAVKDQRADLALAYDDFVLALQFEQFVHETTAKSWAIMGLANDASIDMRSRSSQRPRAIYRPKPGESLERISMRFYGTPDNANLIYDRNHLTSMVLLGFEELIIPEIGA